MLFDLDFANNTFLSCSFSFRLMFDLGFLVPAAVAQVFNPIVELITHIAIPTKELKAEIEIHPVISETKIRKSSI